MRRLVLLALVGLAAQLVDGSLGMGYGVTSATLLVAGGLGPAAASAAIHLSEIGTLLVNLDPELTKPLVAAILLALGVYVTWRFLAFRTLRFHARPSARFLAPL